LDSSFWIAKTQKNPKQRAPLHNVSNGTLQDSRRGGGDAQQEQVKDACSNAHLKVKVGMYDPSVHYFDVDVNDAELAQRRIENSGPFDNELVKSVYFTSKKVNESVAKIYSCPNAHLESHKSCEFQCCFNLCSYCYIARFTCGESSAKRQRRGSVEETSPACNSDDAHKNLNVLTLKSKAEYEVPNTKELMKRSWLSRCSRCGLKWFEEGEVV
jgi:hypothetical protein